MGPMLHKQLDNKIFRLLTDVNNIILHETKEKVVFTNYPVLAIAKNKLRWHDMQA